MIGFYSIMITRILEIKCLENICYKNKKKKNKIKFKHLVKKTVYLDTKDWMVKYINHI
jgi:hypothetical protein